MARIRSIKPEFWDSPSVAQASPWARLLFIALWNWADDYGRGTANLKELEGFAFPNDDHFYDRSGNTVHFRDLVAEVSAVFGVVFYEVESRPYYLIPTWEKHQRNERRAKASRCPDPPGIPTKSKGVAETPSHNTVHPTISALGTGEQGNRGTGEQGNRGTGEQSTSPSEPQAAPTEHEGNSNPDVIYLCNYLADWIAHNGSKRPTITKTWRDECRLMIDKDGRTPDQIRAAIDWSQQDSFWRANVLSMPTLRSKYDQLRLKSMQDREKQSRGYRNQNQIMADIHTQAAHRDALRDDSPLRLIQGGTP